MALCNTAGLKNHFYMRRILMRHKKPIPRNLPLIDYHEKQLRKEESVDEAQNILVTGAEIKTN